MIRYAEVVNENEKNYHSKEGSPFLVLSHPAIVDSENYIVEIKIKKTPFENKFYIHNMNLQNKNETVALNTKDKISRGYNNNELSRTDNIANNNSNVNNNDIKLSRDVDYAEHAELKRENKHLKEINEVLKHQFELTNGREVSIKAR